MSSAIWQILAGQQKRELFEKNGRKSVAILGQKEGQNIDDQRHVSNKRPSGLIKNLLTRCLINELQKH